MADWITARRGNTERTLTAAAPPPPRDPYRHALTMRPPPKGPAFLFLKLLKYSPTIRYASAIGVVVKVILRVRVCVLPRLCTRTPFGCDMYASRTSPRGVYSCPHSRHACPRCPVKQTGSGRNRNRTAVPVFSSRTRWTRTRGSSAFLENPLDPNPRFQRFSREPVGSEPAVPRFVHEHTPVSIPVFMNTKTVNSNFH